MRMSKRAIPLVFGAILASAMALVGCGAVREGVRVAAPIPIETATLVPTITPRPTLTPIPQPTTQASDELLVVPATPNTPFTIEATEQQINQFLAGQAYEQDGASVRDIWVTITDEEIIAQGQGSYRPLNIHSSVTARGAPVLSGGKVYIQIKDLSLDSSVPAFTRFLVELAIEQGIRNYGSPQGIEIETGDTRITHVDLQPGKIVISGVTGPMGSERGA